jgi:hypothetical protein
MVLGDETPPIGAEDTVHSEATGKTSNTPENRLEGLLHVVVCIIFKDWEKKKECVLVKRSLSLNQQLLYGNEIRPYIQLTLEHGDETLGLVFHFGLSTKS